MCFCIYNYALPATSTVKIKPEANNLSNQNVHELVNGGSSRSYWPSFLLSWPLFNSCIVFLGSLGDALPLLSSCKTASLSGPGELSREPAGERLIGVRLGDVSYVLWELLVPLYAIMISGQHKTTDLPRPLNY